ncbi:hypothetical protein CASFOL_036111 [Castilleja foliolosa]|uniref:Trehalose-phosphatase n=1 Tax=Castilleja foliolosa TaxID=1961234 RepID=A0ABD3BVF8_9LAMI
MDYKRGGEMGEMVVVRGDRRILSLVVVLPPSHTSNHPASPTTPAATPQPRPIRRLPAAPIYSPILKGWSLIGQSVEEIFKRYSRLRLTHGRNVLEVRPVRRVKVSSFYLNCLLGLMNCDDVLPIYVGDDRTDEDAFKVSREGNRGDGIIVSSLPKESNAFYSVRDTSEVWAIGSNNHLMVGGLLLEVSSHPLLREGEKEADEIGRKINYLIEED